MIQTRTKRFIVSIEAVYDPDDDNDDRWARGDWRSFDADADEVADTLHDGPVWMNQGMGPHPHVTVRPLPAAWRSVKR